VAEAEACGRDPPNSTNGVWRGVAGHDGLATVVVDGEGFSGSLAALGLESPNGTNESVWRGVVVQGLSSMPESGVSPEVVSLQLVHWVAVAGI
jgi:hypothetical protein